MLESLSSALAGISLTQFALIAGLALFASIVGGVSGYGTGALMPLWQQHSSSFPDGVPFRQQRGVTGVREDESWWRSSTTVTWGTGRDGGR